MAKWLKVIKNGKAELIQFDQTMTLAFEEGSEYQLVDGLGNPIEGTEIVQKGSDVMVYTQNSGEPSLILKNNSQFQPLVSSTQSVSLSHTPILAAEVVSGGVSLSTIGYIGGGLLAVGGIAAAAGGGGGSKGGNAQPHTPKKDLPVAGDDVSVTPKTGEQTTGEKKPTDILTPTKDTLSKEKEEVKVTPQPQVTEENQAETEETVEDTKTEETQVPTETMPQTDATPEQVEEETASVENGEEKEETQDEEMQADDSESVSESEVASTEEPSSVPPPASPPAVLPPTEPSPADPLPPEEPPAGPSPEMPPQPAESEVVEPPAPQAAEQEVVPQAETSVTAPETGSTQSPTETETQSPPSQEQDSVQSQEEESSERPTPPEAEAEQVPPVPPQQQEGREEGQEEPAEEEEQEEVAQVQEVQPPPPPALPQVQEQTQTSTNILYVSKDQTGDRYYSSFEAALQAANPNDTIELLNDVTLERQGYTQDDSGQVSSLVLKAIKIDGKGHKLDIPVRPLSLDGNVEFLDVQLSLQPLTSLKGAFASLSKGGGVVESTQYIFLNGNKLTFDKVRTNVEGQNENTRPTVVLGSEPGKQNDAGQAEFVVRNADQTGGETRLKAIIGGGVSGNSRIELGRGMKVLDKVTLDGKGGKVTLVNKSVEVLNIEGGNSDNEVILENVNYSITSPNLYKVKNLTLTDGSGFTIQAQDQEKTLDISGKLSLSSQSRLVIGGDFDSDSSSLIVGSLKSDNATLKLGSEASFTLNGNISGNLNVETAQRTNPIKTGEGSNAQVQETSRGHYTITAGGPEIATRSAVSEESAEIDEVEEQSELEYQLAFLQSIMGDHPLDADFFYQVTGVSDPAILTRLEEQGYFGTQPFII